MTSRTHTLYHIQLFDLIMLIISGSVFTTLQIGAVCLMSVYSSRDTATASYILILSAQTKLNNFPLECNTFGSNNILIYFMVACSSIPTGGLTCGGCGPQTAKFSRNSVISCSRSHNRERRP